MSDDFRIHFEGEQIGARAGESVAAALMGRGIVAFRRTARGSERGLFCGMGVCQDCLVEIDGEPGQRACMTRVADGMNILRQRSPPSVVLGGAPLPPATIADIHTEQPELLVIGAGPGGLSAAIAARSAGAEVLVIDERSAPGGQYFKPLAIKDADVPPADRQHQQGQALVRRALELGVNIRSGCLVWGAFAPNEFACSNSRGTTRLTPRATIVATGAYERAWPVPGWTLPGVMTTGAAQTLWRTARRLPGQRVLVAGNGPLNLQLAAELASGGAQIVALAEAAPPWGITSIGSIAVMATASPDLLSDGLRYRAALLKNRTRVMNGTVVASVSRRGNALLVELAPSSGAAGKRTEVETDILCLGYGFDPSNEILRALGCQHDFHSESGHLIACRDENGRTSVADVFALGDCTGLGGARLAMAEGTLSGLEAARHLGHETTALEPAKRDAAAAAAKHRRFQAALWQLYSAAKDWRPLVTDDTLICRCEEVSFGTIRSAIASGIRELGALKRQTRAGMGACQGRYCGPLLETCVAEETGRAPDEFSGFAPRIPLKPIAIRHLTAAPQK